MKHLLPLLAFGILPVSAQNISTDDAHQLARQFFTSHAAGAAHHAPAKVDPVLAYTATTEGTPDLYVFNRGVDAPGFVIISADDIAVPVIGYSDNSNFDLASAPSNFLWWLEQYQRYGVAKAPAGGAGDRHDIAPLVTTTWNQSAPFNNALPSMNGYGPLVTGCTATAMAQIMKFHNYPERGKGSHSYQQKWGAPVGTKTFEADFEHTYYDWANMLDSYDGNYSKTQADAVATLMYHAGVAEDSHYGQNATSADDRNSGKALIEHFRYSKSMLRGERQYFSDEEWANTIYNELVARRPVMYSGSTTEGEGHAFVCDGYQASTGRFHINWGWGGTSDGYFALTGSNALWPEDQGTGGAASGQGFTDGQSINYNILPTEDGAAVTQVSIVAGGTLSVTASGSSVSRVTFDRTKDDETFFHYHFCPYNCGLNDAAFEYGVMLRNVDTGATVVSKEGDTNNLKGGILPPGNYYSTDSGPLLFDHSFPTSLLPVSGDYEVLPAFRPMGTSQWQVALYDVSLTVPVITVVGDYVAPEEPLTPELIDGICFYEYPVIGDNNITNSSDLLLSVPFVNNSTSPLPVTIIGVLKVNGGSFTIPSRYTSIPAGMKGTNRFDLRSAANYMTPGNLYTIDFYANEEWTERMNVPSITFYYDGDSVFSISDLTTIIDHAQNGAASLKLVNAARDKILGK